MEDRRFFALLRSWKVKTVGGNLVPTITLRNNNETSGRKTNEVQRIVYSGRRTASQQVHLQESLPQTARL